MLHGGVDPPNNLTDMAIMMVAGQGTLQTIFYSNFLCYVVHLNVTDTADPKLHFR